MNSDSHTMKKLSRIVTVGIALSMLLACNDWIDELYTEKKTCPEDFQCGPGEVCFRGSCMLPEFSEEELDEADEILGFDWVCLPGGDFMMGCPEPAPLFPGGDGLFKLIECGSIHSLSTNKNRKAFQHEVHVTPYCLMATEVTEKQFEQVMGVNPSRNVLGPVHAVENVEWSEAREFCERIGARLPTEAEWEHAAQGAAAAEEPCEDDACVNATEWVDVQPSEKQPVGTKSPNANGLFDLQGNVSEILEDCFHETYDGAPSTGFPAWTTGCDSSAGVEKGGNYGDSYLHWCCRSAFYGGSSSTGFRCARAAP